MDQSQENHLKQKELFSIGNKIPGFKAFGGHSIRLWEDYGLLFEKDVFYFTFFRDPVKRYLSNYFFLRYNMEIDLSFEEYLSDRYFHNFMTKKICGQSDDKQAIQILEAQNVFIGFVEAFDDSLIRLKSELDVFGTNFKINYKKQNVNKNNYSVIKELIDRYNDEIHKNNEMDCKLYDYFHRKFQATQSKQIKVHELKRLKEANTAYQFKKFRIKLQRKLKRLYFQKLEILYRDQSKRKLSI